MSSSESVLSNMMVSSVACVMTTAVQGVHYPAKIWISQSAHIYVWRSTGNLVGLLFQCFKVHQCHQGCHSGGSQRARLHQWSCQGVSRATQLPNSLKGSNVISAASQLMHRSS